MSSGLVESADGTPIAWNRLGEGPAMVLVDCVGASRATTPQPNLPHALAARFSVYRYDRRGKGESGNTGPYAVEREFEDLEAVITRAGGAADVYGFSSGATLALLAARAGGSIRGLALLEPPLMPTPDPGLSLRDEYVRRYEADPAAARLWFLTSVNRIPAELLATFAPPSDEDLRNAEANAHELAFLPGTAADQFAGVAVPTLLIASDHTPPPLPDFASALAEAMPHAEYRVLPGGWHGVSDELLTEAITGFLVAPDRSR